MTKQAGQVWDFGPLQIKLLYRTCGSGHRLGHRYETLMVSWREQYVRLRFTWGRTQLFAGKWTVPQITLCEECIR